MERIATFLPILLLLVACGQQQTEQLPTPPFEPIPKGAQQYDPRTVTIEELRTIPGLNKNVEENIIKFQRNPGFERVEDLLSVPGIGEKTWLKIGGYFLIGAERPSGQQDVSNSTSRRTPAPEGPLGR